MVGTTITLVQLILLFIAGKAISAMWLLVLAYQFIVLISKWQINFDDNSRIFLSELKRMVFAEYFDDYELSKKV